MVKTCADGTEGRLLPDVCDGGPVLCGVQGWEEFRWKIQMYDEIINDERRLEKCMRLAFLIKTLF